MKTKILSLLISLSLLAVFCACTPREQRSMSPRETLSRAEALMTQVPDSALMLLEDLSKGALRGRENRAHFALLYSQALETWDQIIANEPDNIDTDTWRPQVFIYLQNEPEVVELHWTYNDNLSFTTYALVSPFKIIYDNILSFLVYNGAINNQAPDFQTGNN